MPTDITILSLAGWGGLTRFPLIHSAIVTDWRLAQKVGIVVAALLAATALRYALTHLTTTKLTFPTYYPAVLVCSLLAGWRFGSVCALLSGIIAEVLFPSAYGGAVRFPVTDLLIFLSMSSIIIATADTLRRVTRDLDSAREMSRHLSAELQHRVSNTLSVVQFLALQSFRGASPDAFPEVFGQRLQALAKAHRLLGQNELETCALPELIEEACLPFCGAENITVLGPACDLPAISCIPLVLGIHELCTNALKYGALSDPQGKVEISWQFGDRPDRLLIDWKETGGPPVLQPKRKGLGSLLLRPQPGIADVSLSFEKTGLCCKLSIDGAKALESASSDGSAAKHPYSDN